MTLLDYHFLSLSCQIFSRFFSCFDYTSEKCSLKHPMASRKQTREYLLQYLYTASQVGEFDSALYNAVYFSEERHIDLDMPYFDEMTALIHREERSLIDLIAVLAPRFELGTIPAIHILILMISLTEMLYFTRENIPESVSVNEAVELAKKFSDDQGKIFINGALSTFLKDREKKISERKTGTFRMFP